MLQCLVWGVGCVASRPPCSPTRATTTFNHVVGYKAVLRACCSVWFGAWGASQAGRLEAPQEQLLRSITLLAIKPCCVRVAVSGLGRGVRRKPAALQAYKSNSLPRSYRRPSAPREASPVGCHRRSPSLTGMRAVNTTHPADTEVRRRAAGITVRTRPGKPRTCLNFIFGFLVLEFPQLHSKSLECLLRSY